MKDNGLVWAGVNYSDSTQTFIINNTKVEVKAKGARRYLKRKMIKLTNVASIIPTATAPDIESKISMTGYSITNKNTSTYKE